MDRTSKRRAHPLPARVIVGLTGILLVAGALPDAVRPQDAVPVLVRVEDRTRVGARNRVVQRDPRTGADREIYASQGYIPYQLAVSPSGQYVSFIEVDGSQPKRRLVVVELSGRTVRILGESAVHAPRGIREHVWCCGPDKLAVIVGSVGEPGALGEATKLPAGVSVVDVRTGADVVIAGVWRPEQVYWTTIDTSLYIKGAPQVPPGTRGSVRWPVYRYHVPTGRLSLTTHRGVFLSPDGKYYFDRGSEPGLFRVYRTADDEDVTTVLTVPADQVQWGYEHGWMPGADHVLIFIPGSSRPEPKPGQRRKPPQLMDRNVPQLYPDRWNVAVDAETGRVIERFQGDIGAGWKTNSRALPVEGHGGVELVQLRGP